MIRPVENGPLAWRMRGKLSAPSGLISVLIEFLDRIRPTSGYLILMDFLGRRRGLEENGGKLSLSLSSDSNVIEEEGNVNLVTNFV